MAVDTCVRSMAVVGRREPVTVTTIGAATVGVKILYVGVRHPKLFGISVGLCLCEIFFFSVLLIFCSLSIPLPSPSTPSASRSALTVTPLFKKELTTV